MQTVGSEPFFELPFLRTLDDSCIEIMIRTGEIKSMKMKRGGVIHLSGDDCAGIEILSEGKISIQDIDESGNSLIVSICEPPAVLGANLIFAEKRNYPFTVLALSDSTMLCIGRSTVTKLCAENEAFLWEFLHQTSEHAAMLTEKLHTLTLSNIRCKMMDFLKKETQRQQSLTIRLPMSKTELAESMGIRRSSLGRELTAMRNEGILRFDNRTITVTDCTIWQESESDYDKIKRKPEEMHDKSLDTDIGKTRQKIL